jgi:pyruvate carboxylase
MLTLLEVFMLSVTDASEFMLEEKRFFTARDLSRNFNVSYVRAQRWLSSISSGERYEVEIKEAEELMVKVKSINGRKVPFAQLQAKAIMFQRPSMLV